ncbi:MAG TPA: hypothetical protein HA360_00395 [Nanoarchaeota archaeon]|nr:hypothetical protein [Candidatus Woesearchaeota archaeon]HIH14975.1 hypothetical protein [Nanoarchaeota archaeon]HIH58780.1 hypothetical protein [Nanoarchaeota archaeon]HII13511.1 hypothetical protein [Nanoarchaeota archaeon]HIJ05318.1 hypothetical protein [Nanoarchaeota archaeon]
MMNFFWGIGIYWMLFFFTVALLLFLFWLWMFIEALKKRDTMWIILFLVGLFTMMFGWIFALLYYFLEYEKNKKGSKKR